jgi:hypothetical protein
VAHDEWTILNVGRDAPSRFRAARISTTIRRGPWSPARSAPASARHSALPSRSCVFAHGSSPSTGTSVPSANSIEREHDATVRRASALRSERVGVRATAAEARIAFASARAFLESRRPRIDFDFAEEEVLEASEEDARESLSSDDAFAPMTAKSLRNGVHHANAVVWGPVTTATTTTRERGRRRRRRGRGRGERI